MGRMRRPYLTGRGVSLRFGLLAAARARHRAHERTLAPTAPSTHPGELAIKLCDPLRKWEGSGHGPVVSYGRSGKLVGGLLGI